MKNKKVVKKKIVKKVKCEHDWGEVMKSPVTGENYRICNKCEAIG